MYWNGTRWLQVFEYPQIQDFLSSAQTVFLNQTAAKQRNAIDASISCKNRSLEFIPSLVFGNASAGSIRKKMRKHEKTIKHIKDASPNTYQCFTLDSFHSLPIGGDPQDMLCPALRETSRSCNQVTPLLHSKKTTKPQLELSKSIRATWNEVNSSIWSKHTTSAGARTKKRAEMTL